MPASSEPASRYEWLDDWVDERLDGAITLTVVSGRTAEQVLATVGAQIQPGVLSGGLGALNKAPGTAVRTRWNRRVHRRDQRRWPLAVLG
jgi:hypothetical protein